MAELAARRQIRSRARISKPSSSKPDQSGSVVRSLRPALDGREIYQPRGKTLGGSSSTNAMVYIRGNRAAYDEARDMANPGWGTDDVLPASARGWRHQLGADECRDREGPPAARRGALRRGAGRGGDPGGQFMGQTHSTDRRSDQERRGGSESDRRQSTPGWRGAAGIGD